MERVQDIARAIESQAASPDFLEALENHLAQLCGVLDRLRDDTEPRAEPREETPVEALAPGSRGSFPLLVYPCTFGWPLLRKL